jgi:hypothetical protein
MGESRQDGALIPTIFGRHAKRKPISQPKRGVLILPKCEGPMTRAKTHQALAEMISRTTMDTTFKQWIRLGYKASQREETVDTVEY